MSEENTSLLQEISSSFSAWLLRKLGWKIIGGQASVSKAVLTAAPHTTNWDLFYTLLGAWALRIPIWFMMKKNHFWFPAGILWEKLGGVPVDRDKPGGMVAQMATAFSEREKLYLVIPPEGTRKQVPYWRTGFHAIARAADVPIWPWFIDYKNKRLGCGEPLYATGDIDADFARIRAFYEGMGIPLPHCRPKPP